MTNSHGLRGKLSITTLAFAAMALCLAFMTTETS